MDDPARVSIYVSDRHFGIGSDGLITIGPSDKADFRMRIYNADGSEALLLQEKGLIAKNVFFIMKILQVKKLRDIY